MVEIASTRHHDSHPLLAESRIRSGPIRVAVAENVLDEIDIQILSVLQRDGRISKTSLAEMVNLSLSACLDRMRRLEKKKLILSYHATINIKALLNLDVFFTEITLRTHRPYDFVVFENYVKKVDEIVECHALTGGINYLIKIVCPAIGHYQAIMDQLLAAELGIERYLTYAATKSVKTLPQLAVDTVMDLSNGVEPRRPSKIRGARRS